MKERQFIDQVSVHVRAGKGGDGSPSFRREAHVEFGGPDGGDGGNGGSVVLRGSRHEDTLLGLSFSPLLFAENGEGGRSQQRHGRNGKDLVVDVPCGTSVIDEDTDEVRFDIVGDGEEVVVAKGGQGGLGNVHFKSSVNQAPTKFTYGREGEEFHFRLELKVIAEVGLVGYPNAGKSSLLSAISDARPKIASYPFTTLTPVIGTVVFDDFSTLRVADVPGIIDGAHEGVGLGLDFLRHLSRAKALMFVIDAAGVDGRDPWDDYKALRRELESYDPELLKRPTLLVANKLDLPGAEENLAKIEKRARRKAIGISVREGTGIDDLRAKLKALLKPAVPGAHIPPATARRRPPAQDHSEVSGEKFAAATFFDLGPKNKKRR